MSNRRRNTGDDEKGLLWKLPQVSIRDVGKVGPALGLGVGCGVGFGVGLVGEFGPGIPGFQFGFGFGAGCGIGVGRGAAYAHSRSYYNVGKPSLDEVESQIDELFVNTEKFMEATANEIDKWSRR